MKKINEYYSVIGNIGQDATVKTLKSKKKVLNFTLAIDKSYKDKEGNKVKETKWVEVEQWGNESSEFKIAEYLKKGVKVKVTGEPISKAYLNKNNIIQQDIGLIMDALLLL